MKFKLSMCVFISFLLFSCKEEQSCSDGKFSPEEEEKLDCGGVCPPCDFVPTNVDTYMSAFVNGENISFTDFSLEKNPNYILTFQNDSLYFNINLGDGDTLGARPVNPLYSSGRMNNTNYNVFVHGTSVFSEIDNTENKLSGFVQVKFNNNGNNLDTLSISTAEFSEIPW